MYKIQVVKVMSVTRIQSYVYISSLKNKWSVDFNFKIRKKTH